MKSPNYLLPPGSFLQAQAVAGRSRIKTAVLTVLAAHAALLVGLLIQGCKEETPSAAGAAATNAPPPVKTNASISAPLPVVALPPPPAPIAAPTVPAATVPSPTRSRGTVYVVKPGDTLRGIARAHGTTAKAIQSASGLSRDQLKVGQKLILPEPKSGTA